MFTDFTQAAIEIATQAGSFLKTSFTKPHQIFSKEGKKNLVTDCDLFAEHLIVSFLQKKFPHHGFLAEERGFQIPSSKKDPEIFWVIDPLDGTVNFAYQIPIFTVSIAACTKDKVLSGVIFQPMSEELFIAEEGKGAFLNNAPIRVSTESSLDQAFLATGFPYNLQERSSQCISPLISFLQKGVHIRRLGSAALDLAYVASGRFDAFFEIELQPWDLAAGMLLVQEAGGMVSDYEGNHLLPLHPSSLVASNAHIHKSMLNSTQGIFL